MPTIIYFLIAFISFYHQQGLTHVQRGLFQFSWNDGMGGSRWLKVECLSDNLLHFETYEARGFEHEKKGPKANDPIWISPMINIGYHDRFLGASFCDITGTGMSTEERKVETPKILAIINYDLRCIKVIDKENNTLLTNICSEKLDEAKKTLFFDKVDMTNVYGVGNLFRQGDSADGDWIGQHWDAFVRGHGNFRFGQVLNDNFYGGAPSVSQFPAIYVLGNGFKNYGVMIDQIWKVGWDFRNVRFENNPQGLQGFLANMWGDQIRFFVFTGPNLKSLKQTYHELSGFSLVPPKSIFGYWTSEFGYNNWEEIHYDVSHLRSAGFPVDGVGLDLQWFGGTFGAPSNHRMGTLQFWEGAQPNKDSGSFPNPQKNIKDLFDRYGVTVMPIEESYVDANSGADDFLALSNPEERKIRPGFQFDFEDYKDCYLARFNKDRHQGSVPWDASWITTDFRYGGEEGHQVWWGGGGMLDWTSQKARRFWHQLKRHAIARLGIFSFWLDLGEPEQYCQYSHYAGILELEKTDHGSIHNIYNLLWAEGIKEGFARNPLAMRDSLNSVQGTEYSYPPRYFTLSRAGTIGINRHGGMWSGDIASNFESLRAQAHTQRDMSLLGLDYYASDIGGYFHRNANDEFDKEITTQWAAYSSLIESPMRTHAWALGEDWFKNPKEQGENDQCFTLEARGHLESNRANVYRRYELVPYVYSLAHRAHLYGEPIYPPLVYYYQADQSLRSIGNIKMIGSSLLVAMAATFAERERNVRLPEGMWIDYENNQWYQGGSEVGPISLYRKERVPKNNDFAEAHFMLPLFAKEGAIIPKMFVDDKTMNVYGKRSDNSIRNELIVRVYASSERSEFTLYEDDGLTNAYTVTKPHTTNRAFVRETVITQQERAHEALVVIHKANGDYEYATKSRKNIIELVNKGKLASAVYLNNNACTEIKSIDDINHVEAAGDYCWFHKGENNLIRASSKELSVYEDKRFRFRFDR